jgi:hypothetical protein
MLGAQDRYVRIVVDRHLMRSTPEQKGKAVGKHETHGGTHRGRPALDWANRRVGPIEDTNALPPTCRSPVWFIGFLGLFSATLALPRLSAMKSRASARSPWSPPRDERLELPRSSLLHISLPTHSSLHQTLRSPEHGRLADSPARTNLALFIHRAVRLITHALLPLESRRTALPPPLPSS